MRIKAEHEFSLDQPYYWLKLLLLTAVVIDLESSASLSLLNSWGMRKYRPNIHKILAD